MELEKKSREELEARRRQLAHKRAAIDSILDSRAHDISPEEVAELNIKSDLCLEEILKIDALLGNRRR